MVLVSQVNINGRETWANIYPPLLVLRGGGAILLSGPHFLNEGGFPGLSAIEDPPLPVAQIRQDLLLGYQVAAKPPGGGDSCALDEE